MVPPPNIFIVGLTGGIGSGKSTVTQEFEKLGVTVIDSDAIAHQLTEPHAPALAEIQNLFEEKIVINGELQRIHLRELVFKNPNKRIALEAVLHPHIRAELWRKTNLYRDQIAINNAHAAGVSSTVLPNYLIWAIPLLIKKNQSKVGIKNDWQQQCQRILVIDCEESTQRQRVWYRSQQKKLPMTIELIESIISIQATRQDRLAAADDVINTDLVCLQKLPSAVFSLHQKYLTLSCAS